MSAVPRPRATSSVICCSRERQLVGLGDQRRDFGGGSRLDHERGVAERAVGVA